MTRPFYETKDDLKRESAVADIVGQCWKCAPNKLPVGHFVDYALCRGKEIFAWAEIKCRQRKHDAFPTMMFDIRKFYDLKNLMIETSRPAFFIAGFFDQINYMPVEDIDLKALKIELVGRKDRGDKSDLKPGFHVPNEMMKLLVKLEQAQ